MRTELNSCERRNGPADVSRPRSSALIARYSVLWVALSALLLPFGSPTKAQQPGKVPRVGMLFIGGRDQPHLDSFKQGKTSSLNSDTPKAGKIDWLSWPPNWSRRT
jgi:hypothetical protein